MQRVHPVIPPARLGVLGGHCLKVDDEMKARANAEIDERNERKRGCGRRGGDDINQDRHGAPVGTRGAQGDTRANQAAPGRDRRHPRPERRPGPRLWGRRARNRERNSAS